MIKKPSPQNRDYIKTLDALRALAVIMVLVAHTKMIWDLPLPGSVRAPLARVGWGQFGVVLFFVLSGFLITRILIASKGKPRAYRNFLARRSLRIFPIYYLLILALLLIDNGRYLLDSAIYISNYTYSIDNDPNPLTHTWSLCVEEHFYLIWPPIVLFLSLRLSRLAAFIAIPAISVVSGYLIFKFAEHPVDLFYRATNVQAFALALGSTIAFLEHPIRRTPKSSMAISIILMFAGLLIYIPPIFVLDINQVVFKFYGFSFFSAGLLVFCLYLNDSNSSADRFITHSSVIFVGRISYGIYLYHVPIFFYTGVLPERHQSMPMTLVITAMVFATATISYYLIELPILKLKSHYSSS